ncbi:MAG: LysM peptidoglycan-binding domain-containing protein, partial [Pseudomonadota bacterium]
LTRTKPSGAWRVDGQVASFVGQHALTVSAGRSRALIRIAVPTGRRQSITVDLASLAQSRAGQRVRLAQANTSARDQETDADPAPEALPRGGLDEFLDPARRALGRAQRQYRDEVLPRLTTGGSAQGVSGDGNARARPVTDEDNPPPGSGVRERFDQAVDGIRSFLGGAIKGYQGQIVPRLSGGVPETAVTDRERDAEGRRSAEDETRPRDRDQGSTGERTVTRLPGTDDGEAARRAEQQRQARLRAEREAELARQRETEAREARIREREREREAREREAARERAAADERRRAAAETEAERERRRAQAAERARAEAEARRRDAEERRRRAEAERRDLERSQRLRAEREEQDAAARRRREAQERLAAAQAERERLAAEQSRQERARLDAERQRAEARRAAERRAQAANRTRDERKRRLAEFRATLERAQAAARGVDELDDEARDRLQQAEAVYTRAVTSRRSAQSDLDAKRRALARATGDIEREAARSDAETAEFELEQSRAALERRRQLRQIVQRAADRVRSEDRRASRAATGAQSAFNRLEDQRGADFDPSLVASLNREADRAEAALRRARTALETLRQDGRFAAADNRDRERPASRAQRVGEPGTATSRRPERRDTVVAETRDRGRSREAEGASDPDDANRFSDRTSRRATRRQTASSRSRSRSRASQRRRAAQRNRSRRARARRRARVASFRRRTHRRRHHARRRAVVRRTSHRCRRAGRRTHVPGRYVVARGDSLWRIARRHYGRGVRYRRIYRANRRKIRRPSLIYPCQRFRVP